MRSSAKHWWWPSPLAWSLAVIPTVLTWMLIDEGLPHLPQTVIESITGTKVIDVHLVEPAGVDL